MYINVLPGDWGSSCLEDIFCVLDSVRAVFGPHFGIIAPPVTVGRISGDNDPICFRSERLILLNAADMEWNRFAYQFSHEYCHFQIPTDVQPRLRWFEESLCELASYYFMPLIADLWETNPPYPHWRDYALNFRLYANDASQKCEHIDLCFSDPENRVLNHLEENEYDRPKNARVALALRDIFKANPTLWSCIPLICQIPTGLNFRDALFAWSRLVPSRYKDFICQIAGVFSLQISTGCR